MTKFINQKNEIINKLRGSGLRPTKQRILIAKNLFDNKKTFHFTVNDLSKIIKGKLNEKISLATIYNTVHAFEKKGYLKKISSHIKQLYNFLSSHGFNRGRRTRKL